MRYFQKLPPMCSVKISALKNFAPIPKNTYSEEHLRTTASVLLKSRLQIIKFKQYPKTSFSILGFIKIFSCLLSFVNFSSTNFCLLSRLSHILNISNVSFSSSLNSLNSLSFKTLSKICTHRQRVEPESRFYLAKLCSSNKYFTTASLIKVSPLVASVHLILKVHNTLFTDPN